jgi:hypothetical protein
MDRKISDRRICTNDISIKHSGRNECDGRKVSIPDTPVDPINPAHYRQGIEVIDFISSYKLGYELGNAVKYISRAGKKDPSKELEDLKKAQWYLDRKIDQLEKQQQV